MNQRGPEFYVACLSDVHGWGGGLTLAQLAATDLAAHGGATTLLGVARKSKPLNTPLPPPPREFSRMNIDMPEPTRWGWRWQSWLTAGQLAAELRKLPAPRTAFVSVSPFWCVAGRRAWPGVPNVYFFPCLLTNCLPFVDRAAGVWQRLERAAIARCERRAFQTADRVLAPTRTAIDEILGFEPSARERVVLSEFGCRPMPFDAQARARIRRELGLAESAFVVLAAGVLDRNKAFDLLIRELPRMDASVHAIIAGDGPQRAALLSLASGLGVAGRTRLVSPGRECAAVFAAADAVASTSHYDTFPNVLLEALTAGRPVIAPRHDPPRVFAGIAELLLDHGGGVLYSREAPGALAEAVNRLVSDPALHEELATQALRLAQRRLTRSTLADQIFAVCGAPESLAVAGAVVGKEDLACLTSTR
jgi:glycosyltransferase involved in cell wall biosynthesis